MANTTYIDEQGRRKTGYTEGLNIPTDSIYAKRLEQLDADKWREINNLNEDYMGKNTQLYRDYMNSKKNLPQQLSAQGISGGLSESTNLGLETLYTDRLLQNERERQRGVSEIESKSSNNAMSVLQDYTANAAERANTMASIGDFSGYKELGYTDGQIAALKNAWDASHAPKVRNYSYSQPDEKLSAKDLKSYRAKELYSNLIMGTMTDEQISYRVESALRNHNMSETEAKFILSEAGY